MDDLSSGTENVPVSHTAAVPKKSVNSVDAMMRGSRRRSVLGFKKPFVFLIGLLLIAIVALGSWSLLNNRNSTGIEKDSYQAVFLTNNQVYFGKLTNATGDYLTMTDIFYLQVQQTVQSSKADTTTDTSGSDNVKLIKLGNELHGPKDRMQISAKQVLFWENLKADGKVAKAIDKYKADNK